MIKKFIRVALGIFLILVGIALFTHDYNDTTQSNNKEKFDYEVTKSYKDSANIAYYIEGTVTNKLSKDYSYVQIEFICYDKSGNNLGTAIDNTNNLLGNQTWKFKAMGMFTDAKNVDHCDFHEVSGW